MKIDSGIVNSNQVGDVVCGSCIMYKARVYIVTDLLDETQVTIVDLETGIATEIYEGEYVTLLHLKITQEG